MAENTQTERQVITLGEVSYFTDSVGEQGQKILADVQNIQARINQLSFDKNVMELAVQTLVDNLAGMTDTFEAVPQADADEVPENETVVA